MMINEVVEEITMKAMESQNEFIFQTIQPYCENITEQRISKRQLEEALLLYFNKKKLIKEWLDSFNTESASVCFNKIQELKGIVGAGSEKNTQGVYDGHITS